jgi:hypothetical protein
MTCFFSLGDLQDKGGLNPFSPGNRGEGWQSLLCRGEGCFEECAEWPKYLGKREIGRNWSRIFGSNSAYSGAVGGILRSVLNDRNIWKREKDSPIGVLVFDHIFTISEDPPRKVICFQLERKEDIPKTLQGERANV